MSPSGKLGPTPRSLEVQDLASFDHLVAAGAVNAHGWHAQSLDLRGRSAALTRLDVAGAMFLGCTFDDGMEASLRRRGALIFPRLQGVPFNPYRSALYTPAELYAGLAGAPYEDLPDARIYHWSIQPGREHRVDATLASSLHDHAIGDALDELLRTGPWSGKHIVGVMGGHAAQRGSRDYAGAARLGKLLVRDGHIVATGGGPGAMEAANLGAYLGRADDGGLDEALGLLSAVPGFRPSVSAWARAAAAVVERFSDGTPSLGIPTWFYGHEPPNYFATHIAKYFANSIREAVLLDLCQGGIIFLPGAAGTVQEIFQDACENYYGAREKVTPMVLVGTRYWTQDYPAWPLLEQLAAGRAMEGRIFLVDTEEQAAAALRP
ncbi:Predicted Rossmann fold nucleotide-binding protein [Pseudarthrobacter enclensis]|uniref:Rossmann fold nucleotide-binding protein n=1 Tax=Pseudarthrobacter enclensis TaxID=993070 RepID=A0A0V8I6L0_9MICC|nr:LOG family protein [Pseudarthrobacter enclensis]KSU70423.1 Rossmann fold nucleotide-binding protein [Pseudarthrobacter enclensis]SCC28305.1 Predicted Rossmann fold nucleotide-binding protein [Pseudarthrobacter enclensis]